MNSLKRISRSVVPCAHVLEILALSSFALAQPLFDLLSRNAEFLVAHQSKPLDVILLVLSACLFPTLFFVLLEILAGIFGPRTQRGVHALFVALLAVVILLPPLKRIPRVPGKGLVLIAIFLGVAFSACCWRVRQLRLFLSFLSTASLFFPLLFLFHSPVYKLIFGQVQERNIAATHIGAPAPIVMVIFDEFPLISLLDDALQINATRYPNFAEFARSATWYRNATTVAEGTLNSVSTILDGNYPRLNLHLVPNAKDHPRSLFSLLGEQYEFNVVETNTRLCPEALCGDDDGVVSSWQQTVSLFSDLRVLYLYLILPADLTPGLPNITQSWKNFALTQPRRVRPWAVYHDQVNWSDRPRRFREFVASIQPSAKPTLHFLHVLLPHAPWLYLPSGKQYSDDEDIRGLIGTNDKGIDPNLWTDDRWATIQSHQRHLLQVQFVDHLFGELLSHLKKIGLYDSTLIVVTADHGTSFHPNDSRRRVSLTNYPDILAIPLLIKVPHQQRGIIDDRNVETVDILPTIADILRAPIPWKVEGQSAVSPSQPDKAQKTVISEVGKTLVFNSPLGGIQEAVAQKLRSFGPPNDPSGYFRVGFYKNLIGQSVNELAGGKAVPFECKIDGEASLHDVDFESGILPAYITGQIRRDGKGVQDPLHLALATQGRVQAVTETYRVGDEEQFSVVLPASAFRQGHNEVDVFAILDREGGPVLASLAKVEQANYKWGTAIDFTSKGNAEQYEAEGWGTPESYYTWSTRKAAQLVLPTELPKSPVTLKARLSAFLVPGKVEKQTVRVLVDNHFAGEWVITQVGMQEKVLTIPNQLFTNPGETIIGFEMPNAIPPNTIGAGADLRELAIAVASLSLTN